jgi:Na+/H+-dicarboxylate symporter
VYLKEYLIKQSIDQFLVMGRTATNVIGNSIATAAVAKWKGAPGSPVEHAEWEADELP